MPNFLDSRHHIRAVSYPCQLHNCKDPFKNLQKLRQVLKIESPYQDADVNVLCSDETFGSYQHDSFIIISVHPLEEKGK